jgi:hypothetical protein
MSRPVRCKSLRSGFRLVPQSPLCSALECEPRIFA